MLNRIIRVADILHDIEELIESISFTEHNSVKALILMDYCNETVLKAVYFHLFNKEINKKSDMWQCWGDINKELKSGNHNVGISELPFKQEILNVIHKKRNFVQHSGESVNPEEIIRYSANSKAFIGIVLKEIMGEDINTLSPVRYIKSLSYQYLLSKAIKFEESDPKMAGAFIRCVLGYANDSLGKKHMEVNKNIGNKISNYFHTYSSSHKYVFDIVRDVGDQIDKNAKTIKGIIQEGCNPPKDILAKLPHGHLMGDQSFVCVTTHEDEVTSEDIKLSMNFAIRFIIRLEKFEMLTELNLDIDKGVTIKK